MINTVIVDDDEKNLVILKNLLGELHADIQIAGEARNAEEAAKIIPPAAPHLVFLDIEMPFGNAFDLLDKLMPVDFEIIFITAFDEYSLKAFRYSALDYLLKPVKVEHLRMAVAKAEKKIALKNINAQLSNLLFNLTKQPSTSRIAMRVKDGFEFIEINEITTCQSKHDCTVVQTRAGKTYICDRTIKEYETILPETSFFRIHHSYIVNMGFIKKFFKDGRGGYVELIDGTTIPVAHRRKDIFLSKFRFN